MLTPDYFYGKSDKLVELYQELEDWILQDIAMRLLRNGEISGTADRELWRLQQLGLHNDEIVKKIAKLSCLSQKEVRRILRESVMTSFSDDEEVLSKLGTVTPPLQNNAVIAAMFAEMQKTFGELNNLTRTTMLQSQKDLLNLLNEVDLRVATGFQSYSSAVCEVLDRYAQKGVTIDYPTGATRSLEAAVRCCIVTSMNQTAAQVTNQYIAEGGIEYVLVSAHMGARHDDRHPEDLRSHDHWQGKVYKIVGRDDGIENLLEATGYTIDPDSGQGTVVNPLGLHGYNCRHSHKPWDPSLRNPYVDADGKPKIDIHESLELYQRQQEQRRMERAIRKTKRELLMKKAEIDGVAETDVKEMLQPQYDKLAYKLRTQNQAYEHFCAEHDLQTQAERLKVAGFKKKQASVANGRATAYENKMETNAQGLSANTRASSVPDHPKPILKEIIDYEDREKVNKILAEFEKDAQIRDIENACVITREGKVYLCQGTENQVFPDVDLGNELIGAYVSHNHPIEHTQYSFSNADFSLFCEYKLAILRGVDIKYKYEFNRNDIARDAHMSIMDITDEDYAHEMAISNAEREKVGYRRWKND